MPKASRVAHPPETVLLPGRPAPDDYFMGIAYAVRERANCRGYKVGAIVVLPQFVREWYKITGLR